MYCSKCGAALAGGVAFCPACGQSRSDASPAAAGAPMGIRAAATADFPPLRYAGFWLRLVAYIIDGIIVGSVFLIIFGFLAALTGIGSTLRNIRPGEASGCTTRCWKALPGRAHWARRYWGWQSPTQRVVVFPLGALQADTLRSSSQTSSHCSLGTSLPASRKGSRLSTT